MSLRAAFRVVPAIALLCFVGCDVHDVVKPGTPTAPGASTTKKLRIAVIPKGTTHDFWKSVHAGAEDAAKEIGNIEIVWQGPADEKDKEAQIKIIDSFVGEQIDGICMAPIDRDALIPAVKRAKAAGVPTVIFDSGLSDDSDVVSTVSTDNRNGGRIAGERLAEVMGGKGGVILLRYQAGSESTENREEGFLEVIAKHPDIKVLSAEQRVDSDAQGALKIAESLLREHHDSVNGVFTVCEPNNKGMLQALENEKLAGKVKFVAFDSDPRMVEGLSRETVHGVVLQDPVRMGYLAVKTMAAHLKGETPEKKISTGEKLATPENREQPEMKALLAPKQYE
ncbi:MAG: substrate-binding domain-containing protein [Planctomycetaceae bacterium]|nr:substrate-binding domain-containing protein [Planctomycetaceae bacterium]